MRILTNIFTPREFVKVLEKESGKKINYHEVSFEDFDKIQYVPGLQEAWAKCVYSSGHNVLTDGIYYILMPCLLLHFRSL